MSKRFIRLGYPIFAVEWNYFLVQEKEDTAIQSIVVISGGGGSTKSGILNKVELFEPSLAPNSPTLRKFGEIDTDNQFSDCFSLGNQNPILVVTVKNESKLYNLKSENTVQVGHFLINLVDENDFVSASCLSPTDRFIAVGTETGSIQIFSFDLDPLFRKENSDTNTDTNQLSTENKDTMEIKITELPKCVGHSKSISSLTFHPNFDLLCSSSKDGTCRIWEISSGKEICTLFATKALSQTGQKVLCRACKFSNNGSQLFVGLNVGKAGYLICWNLDISKNGDTWEVKHSIVTTKRLSETPITSLTLNNKLLVVGNLDGGVLIFRMPEITKINTLSFHKLPVTGVVLAPTRGNKFLLPSCELISVSADKNIALISKPGSSSSLLQIIFFFVLIILVMIWWDLF